MSLTVCIAPANTIAYPQGGGHFWVYLHWALGLRALGCNVIWLEEIDPSKPEDESRRNIAALRAHLARWEFERGLALTTPDGRPVPTERGMELDLDAASEADLLLNFWHSMPARIVDRFRRSALVDTDPGQLQIWISEGSIRPAPHDIYFTIGETVGTPGARFPDCGLRWLYTAPAVFLPEWPCVVAESGGAYTTVAHWWGGTFEYNGTRFWNEKRVAFLPYLDLPPRAGVQLELAVCLGKHFDEYRELMEPRGWRLREAWEVSSSPEQYRSYIQQSRGEFSCAKPAYVRLETGWVSDRTLCYLASGKPAVVEHTGASAFLPDADGLFRFRNVDEAAAALEVIETDYERHCKQARALAEEYFDARRVAAGLLERALEPRAMWTS